MTGMPEASLAREIGLCYATCAVVANWAAGKGSGEITMDEIEKNLEVGLSHISGILEALLS
jgi:5'-methylthioinosine phosphorylase